jgi:HSP20 family molecular chaperone IbpA
LIRIPREPNQLNQLIFSIAGERVSKKKGPEYREPTADCIASGVETDKIAPHYEHGVLEIRVPFPAQLVGRKIPIQIEQKDNKRKLESKVA